MDYPVFIKGDVAFRLHESVHQFLNKGISIYGVNGLGLKVSMPIHQVGSNVLVKTTVLAPTAYAFQCKATLVREQSKDKEYAGLRFLLDTHTRDKLQSVIREHGYYPTEYLRKFPRIPYSNKIQTFPVRAIIAIAGKKSNRDNAPMICEVRNISLGGILISTENPHSIAVEPGTRLDIFLEPRGNFALPIAIEGTVCRTYDDINRDNGNLVREFGIQFAKVDAENRAAYLELVRDILKRIQLLEPPG